MALAQAIQLRTQLEGELSWRRDEVREVRNWRPTGPAVGSSDSHKRVLVVMIYAHLEGFVKAALQEYGKSINDCGLTISDAQEVLAAACLATEFKTYRQSEPSDPHDPHSKHSRQILKDARLVEKIRELNERQIKLDLDEVLSTDSNLSPIVLRRNLAMLAIDHSSFNSFMRHITGLLKRRNPIAHGDQVKLPNDKEMIELEESVFTLCETLMKVLYESARDEGYKRTPRGSVTPQPSAPSVSSGTK